MSHQAQRYFCARLLRDPRVTLPASPRVLDAGSLDINGGNRWMFPGAEEYIGIDIGAGRGVDIVCDARDFEDPRWLRLVTSDGEDGAERAPLGFDVVVSTEMLEHCDGWHIALRNLYRQLRPGGLMVLTWAGPGRPEHGTRKSEPKSSPFTNDYYRNLTPEEVVAALGGSWQFYATEYEGAPAFDGRFYGVKR